MHLKDIYIISLKYFQKLGCINLYGDTVCNDYKDKGYCTSGPTKYWMKNNCMKACDLCPSKSSSIELFDLNYTNMRMNYNVNFYRLFSKVAFSVDRPTLPKL